MKKIIIPNCIDCGIKLSKKTAKRCKSCYYKYAIGRNSANYIDGGSNFKKCIDCGEEIWPKAERCLFCRGKYLHGKNHHNWTGGIKYSKCIECGKQISPGAKRCMSCRYKYYIGKRNPYWTNNVPLWNKKSFQKNQALARHLKPNKPEKFLIKLLHKHFPKEYKYVGDFQFWLGGKNPDFMNVNGQKKLIELYGSYWHKDENPKDRIRHFKQYGFDTLIIWEKELKNISKLEKKLEEFHNQTKSK